MQNVNWDNYFVKPDTNSYDLFIENILPKLINIVLTKDPTKTKIKIAIACHGNFIGKHILDTYQFVEKNNKTGNPVFDNHGKRVLELKDKDVNSDRVKIFYSPPKNADAYEESLIYNKSNHTIVDKRDLIIQLFPENPTPNRPNNSLSKANAKFHRDKDTRFFKYDKFEYIFEPILNCILFDIRDKFVQTRLLKAIKLRMGVTNEEFNKMLKTTRFWNNIMGLCFMENVDKMYTKHYQTKICEPLLLEGGKLKKRKSKSSTKSKVKPYKSKSKK